MHTIENDKYLLCPILWDEFTIDQYEFVISTQENGSEIADLPVRLDRLLSKWLKLSKRHSIPENWHSSSLYYLQMRSQVLKNSQTELFFNCDPIATVKHNFPSNSSQCVEFNQSVCLKFSPKAPYYNIVVMSKWLPFVIVRMVNLDDLFLTAQDFDCDFPFDLVPTTDSTIYVLVFSKILSTAKDCAKLLRLYCKFKTHDIWSSKGFHFFLVRLESSKTIKTTSIAFDKGQKPDCQQKQQPLQQKLDFASLVYEDSPTSWTK